MAQVKRNKYVKKNCIDVEKVIVECLECSNREEVPEIIEPRNSSEVNKKVLKFTSKYNAKFHQELIPIDKIKYKLPYRNFSVY